MTNWVEWGPGQYSPFTSPITPPDVDVLDTGGVCIRLRPEWVPAIIGCLNTLTIPATWSSNQDFAIQQSEKLINEIASAAGLTVITFTLPHGWEPSITKVGCTLYIGVPLSPNYNGCGGDSGACEKEKEKETMPQIIKIGGIAYLTNNCGCGDTELYRLSPASVEVDSKSGNASVLSAASSEKTGKIPNVSQDNFDCFAAKVVPYLLGRALEFAGVLETIIEEGVTALSGSVGDWLDIGGVVQLVLLGGASDFYELISGYSMSDVENAYNDSAFQATMLDAWVASGDISRADLREWVEAAPLYVPLGDMPEGVVPINGWKMRQALKQWVNFSLLSGLADDIQEMAAECESGATIEGRPAFGRQFYAAATAVCCRARNRTKALVISAAMPGTANSGRTTAHPRIPNGTVSKMGWRKGT